MDELRRPAKRSRRLKRVPIAVLSVIVLLAIFALGVANSQDGPVRILQSWLSWNLEREPNSFAPASPPRNAVRPDGMRVWTNVAYGSRFPNSFLDIWYPSSDTTVKRPTVLYMHGGGFFMGSKDSGDPFAGGKPNSMGEPIAIIARNGFNVINLDYALAPAHRYPTPLIQLNQALRFLATHADEYGLDMTRVFLMGGSAGAQLSAQYGLLLSNAAYAEAVGIEPAIAPTHVKGLVLFSPPLKVSGFGWRMNTMMRAYLDTSNLESSRQAMEMDILSKLNAHYPATYITDGNQPDTFPEHAKAMSRILRDKNVDHAFNYYDASVARLDHGYTGRLNTRYGHENLEKAISFMKRRASDPGAPPSPGSPGMKGR